MLPGVASGKALVVDDEATLRSLLAEFLVELGLEVVEAANGMEAIALAGMHRPELILLDVSMPVMDGRQTLKRLRRDPELGEIPIIVVSGEQDTATAVECIASGATDFVTKPFSAALLRARMRAVLDGARLRRSDKEHRRRLEAHGLELEEKVRQATRELLSANERLTVLDRAKSEFLTLIAHELRTPMTGVLGGTELLADPALDEQGRREALEILNDGVARLLRIVEDALMLTRIKVGSTGFSLAPRDLGPVVNVALKRAARAAAAREITLEPAGAIAGRVLCDEQLLLDALAAVLESAIKLGPARQPIRVAGAAADDACVLRITVSTQPVPPELAARFFDVLSLVEPLTPGGDLGLGPPVAAEILRLLGGGVALENTADGVCFVVTLQAAPPA
jgi:two-component system, sensor histidine kinase and response regulator